MMRRLAAGLAALALAGCATEREAAELMLPTRTSSLADVQVVTSPGGMAGFREFRSDDLHGVDMERRGFG